MRDMDQKIPHKPLAIQLLKMGGFGLLFDFIRIQLKYVVSDAFSSGRS